MKKTKSIRSGAHFILIFGVTILFVVTSSTFAQTGRIETVVVHSQALEGNLLGDSPDRSVSIYLPSAYDLDTTARFSVIYLLHGYTHTNVVFLNLLSKSTLDNFFSQGTVQPMIIVIPSVINAYRGSWFTNSIVTGNWEDFITQDLVEYIDNNYRTSPDALSRGMSGYSMGGYGAIYLAMKHPEVYSAVYSLSGGPLDFEDVVLGTMFSYLVQAVNATQFNGLPWQAQMMVATGAAFAPNINPHPFYCDFPVDTNGVLIDSVWQRWLQHDPFSLIESYRQNLLQLNIRFDCGTLDNNFYSSNQNFSSALTTENIPHTFLTYVGNHELQGRVRYYMLPFFSDILTDIESDHLYIPDEFSLFQNYPNPFNPSTNIKYSVPETGSVKLSIYSVIGEQVTILVNEIVQAGFYEVTFDASNLPSGIYFYQLKTKGYLETKKMILMK